MALRRPDPNRPRRLVEHGADGPALRPDTLPARAPLIRDPELDAMRAADEARDASFHPLSERGKRRWKLYVLGSLVFFPLVTYIFTTAGLGGLVFQVLIAALYGTFVALARPGPALAALATLLAGTLTQALAGVPTSYFAGLLYVLSLFIYATAGLLVGITQDAKLLNGE